MKRVLLVGLLSISGVAMAAPAPVEDAQYSQGQISKMELLERKLKASTRGQIELQQRLDVLQQEVLELRGQNEELTYQLEQLVKRQRQIFDELAELSMQKTAIAVTPATPEFNSNTPSTQSLSETDSYQKAVDLVIKARKYDQAIPAFESFIKQYPNSAFVANAHFWLGQLLFNKKQYDKAQTAFALVVNQYPKSLKVAESLVKLGQIAVVANNKPLATKYFKQVIKQHPKTTAATIAQQELNQI
ncbi:tol-pal system protein YbgF [Paraferrimonas sp. SM1919]|uniref:tol-pal system protein YbgF n=1 Tax=Paraferrimonas sp. SM1919 TaxID=2662263 RepID=UPI0013D03A00|nr:tol-pal system protein YbgF [Paraferrimonas sp. SM1919]